MGRQVLLTLIAAASVAVGGYVHFKIWQHEYRHAPVREMFVANWVASAVVVVLLLLAVASYGGWLIRVAAALGVLLAAGSLVAFGLSRGPGLPTLHGKFKETGLETTSSYVFKLGSAKTVLVAEGLALLTCGVLLLEAGDDHRRRSA